jgi:hypothetical protein
MRYVRSPPSGLSDSTAYPAFFMAPAINPRTVCRCQPIFSTISARVAPPLRCSIATTCAVLVPTRGAPASGPLAAFLPLGARFDAMAFFPNLPLTGAAGASRFAFRCGEAFPVASSFAYGSTFSPNLSIRPQIRFPAVLLSRNFVTGTTPVRLFQIATSRSAGQETANSPNSC